MLLAGLGEQDGELFSSVTADHVDFPQLLRENRGHLAQHFITKQMAKFVVQPFELVDIHHDHRHARVEPAGTLQLLLDSKLEVAAVKDSSQAVQVGQMLDSFHVMSILNRSRTDIGDRFQGLNITDVEATGPDAVQDQNAQRLPKGNQWNAHPRTRFHIDAQTIWIRLYVILNHGLALA